VGVLKECHSGVSQACSGGGGEADPPLRRNSKMGRARGMALCLLSGQNHQCTGAPDEQGCYRLVLVRLGYIRWGWVRLGWVRFVGLDYVMLGKVRLGGVRLRRVWLGWIKLGLFGLGRLGWVRKSSGMLNLVCLGCISCPDTVPPGGPVESNGSDAAKSGGYALWDAAPLWVRLGLAALSQFRLGHGKSCCVQLG
jgi:hypothetical protein